MKNYIILVFSICIILLALSACGDNSLNGGSKEPTLEKVADILNIQQGAGLVYRKSLQESGDTLAALEAMGLWIGENPAVKEAWYHDLESIEILYKNGLRSSVQIIPTDENGVHLTRGESTAGTLEEFVLNRQKDDGKPRKIKNDKVLILIPYASEFGYYSWEIEKLRESFGVNLQVDVKTEREEDMDVINMDDINSMGDYGFIILNTHGQKHGFSIGKLQRTFVEQDPWLVDDWTPEKTKRELFDAYNIPLAKVENGEIEIFQIIERKKKWKHTNKENIEYNAEIFTISVLVTEKYIRNSGIDLTDSVVFGNHCYSGHTADGPNKNNMAEAWRSKGAVTYYGYAYDDGVSVPVDNIFSKDTEKKLIKRLVEDTDTTGVAHLGSNGAKYFDPYHKYVFRSSKSVRESLDPTMLEQAAVNKRLYFNHFFDTDYSYGCGTFTDPRDNEEYELACIGEQTWFAENLRYANKGVCYENNAEHCKTYGRLYSIMELTGGQESEENKPIQGLCPKDWHVPSGQEWESLFDSVGGEKVAGDLLKADSLWNGNFDDSYGFGVYPSGRWGDWAGFIELTTDAYFWTSSINGTNRFEVKHFQNDDSSVVTFYQRIKDPANNPEMKASGRCVKNQ